MESFTKTATSDMEKEIMRDTNIRFEKLPGRGFAATVAFATFALLLAGCAQVCLAQQPGTKPFRSADEARRIVCPQRLPEQERLWQRNHQAEHGRRQARCERLLRAVQHDGDVARAAIV